MSDTDRQYSCENEDVAAALGSDFLESNDEVMAISPNVAQSEGAFSLEAMPSEADWRAIAARLYERNGYLLEKVRQLKQAFTEVQKELDIQTVCARHAEDLLAQREADLETAYEERLRLREELQTAREAARQHHALVESLGEQLAASQTRVAQMERECASIQQQCQEYAASAAEAERQSADLYARLQQQREHTWQFKAALDRCLREAKGGESEAANGDRALEPIAPWSSVLDEVPEIAIAPEWPEESVVELPEGLTSLARFGLDLPAVSFKIEIEKQFAVEDALKSGVGDTQLEVDPDSDRSEELPPAAPSSSLPLGRPEGHGSEPSIAESVPEAKSGDESDEEETEAQNYPSPVVYPRRTRKKRDSLAAIELPRFFQ